MDIEKFTFNISIYIQLLGIIIIPLGFLVPFKKEKITLYNCLQLETIVNVIELLSYIIIGYFVATTPDIAYMRYYDWFVTTPLLLFSVILYFQYLKNKKSTINTIISDKHNRNLYIKIIVYNTLMLLSGFLGELHIIPKPFATIIGFLFFILLFKELWKFAEGDERSERFFKYFMTLWSFYGISYMFQSKIKNTGYNILDLFSKTFYGLLILYKYIRD